MSQTTVFILIAPDFEEQPVINCLCRMRDERLYVRLVGLATGLLSGLHGLTVRPDMSLTQLQKQPLANDRPLVMVAGGRACMTALLADPRVHHLLDSALAAEGFIAVMSPAQEFLASTTLHALQNGPHLLVQNGLSNEAFTELVISRIA